jgi:hypothetical protein
MDPLEIQGDPPSLAGKTCEALVCHEHWHQGRLIEPANVIFIRANGVWHKLFFDSGIICWKSGVEPDPAFDAPEISSMFKLVDLGHKFQLIGRRIAACDAAPTPKGAKVTVKLEGGRSVVFESSDDVTSYVAA